MAGGRKRSVEEFYSQCLGNARTLDAAARRMAASGDAVGSLATAWGADIYAVQAVVWERIIVASTVPQRHYFRAAEALLVGLSDPLLADQPTASLRDVLDLGRRGVLEDCDADLREGLNAAWTDHGYLVALRAPTPEDLAAAAGARLGGMTAPSYVAAIRREAADAMVRAQELRIKGQSVPAIQAAYDSDFTSLEAYLIESAVTAGDTHLLTVTIRWELATHAVSALPGLPEGFLAAVARIREAIAGGLGEADGARLRGALARA